MSIGSKSFFKLSLLRIIKYVIALKTWSLIYVKTGHFNNPSFYVFLNVYYCTALKSVRCTVQTDSTLNSAVYSTQQSALQHSNRSKQRYSHLRTTDEDGISDDRVGTGKFSHGLMRAFFCSKCLDHMSKY